jgi:MFS transporter, FSR family, fosmidomycin resistance protein
MLVRSAAQLGAEGRVFGIVSTGFNIGGVARPVLFGWLLDHAVPQFVFGTSVVFMVLTVGLPLFQERRRPAAPMDGRIIR